MLCNKFLALRYGDVQLESHLTSQWHRVIWATKPSSGPPCEGNHHALSVCKIVSAPSSALQEVGRTDMLETNLFLRLRGCHTSCSPENGLRSSLPNMSTSFHPKSQRGVPKAFYRQISGCSREVCCVQHINFFPPRNPENVRELQTRPNSHLPARDAPKDQNKHVRSRAPTPSSVSSEQEQTYTNSHPPVEDAPKSESEIGRETPGMAWFL